MKESQLSDSENQQQDKSYNKKRKIYGIISLVALVTFFIVIGIIAGKPMLDFISQPEKFQEWASSQGILGRLTIIGIMTLQVVFAAIPGEVIEIGAGYAFGAVEGTLLCIIGAAVGSVVIFYLTRLFGVKLVEIFISREKINSLNFIKDSKKLNLLIFILFFIPGTPKDLFTYFIGLTPMKLTTFLIISSIARIPSVITSTIGGNALGSQNYSFAVIVFAITAIMSIAGILVYRKISKKNNK